MANRRLARIIPTDSWPELQPLLLFPDQEVYEVIRPVVLFGFTPLERAQETGVSARSICLSSPVATPCTPRLRISTLPRPWSVCRCARI